MEETIEKQSVQIEQLTTTVTQERSRVVALSTLAAPFMKLQSASQEMYDTYLTDLQSRLYTFAKTQSPSFHYGKSFNVEDFELTQHAEDKRRNKGKKIDVDELDSTIDIVETLLIWSSAKSRDANNCTDPQTGKALDFLPKYKKIGDIPDLKNGVALLSIVLALIWDLPSMTKMGSSTLRLPQEATQEASSDDKVLPFEEIITQAKGSVKTPFETITCALELAAKYLYLPNFQVGDIVSCRADISIALLGYLMLASSSPAQHPNSLGKVSQLIGDFEKKKTELNPMNPPIQLGNIKAIHKRLAHLHGQNDQESTIADDSVILDEAKDNDGVEEKKNEDVADAGSVEGNGDAKDDISIISESANVTVKVELTEKEMATAKYTQLAEAVDGYLMQLGSFDASSFTYSNSESILNDQVGTFMETFQGVVQLNNKVVDHSQECENGYRVAIDVRNAVTRFQQEMLFSELKWL